LRSGHFEREEFSRKARENSFNADCHGARVAWARRDKQQMSLVGCIGRAGTQPTRVRSMLRFEIGKHISLDQLVDLNEHVRQNFEPEGVRCLDYAGPSADRRSYTQERTSKFGIGW
jgi:hypothetical protein